MLNTVTVWHNGIRRCYPLISARKIISVDKNGIKQKGFFDSSKCTLRIPAKADAEFSIGDFARIGEHTGDADRRTDFKIMEIHGNLRGAIPHYRLICEK